MQAVQDQVTTLAVKPWIHHDNMSKGDYGARSFVARRGIKALAEDDWYGIETLHRTASGIDGQFDTWEVNLIWNEVVRVPMNVEVGEVFFEYGDEGALKVVENIDIFRKRFPRLKSARQGKGIEVVAKDGSTELNVVAMPAGIPMCLVAPLASLLRGDTVTITYSPGYLLLESEYVVATVTRQAP